MADMVTLQLGAHPQAGLELLQLAKRAASLSCTSDGCWVSGGHVQFGDRIIERTPHLNLYDNISPSLTPSQSAKTHRMRQSSGLKLDGWIGT